MIQETFVRSQTWKFDKSTFSCGDSCVDWRGFSVFYTKMELINHFLKNNLSQNCSVHEMLRVLSNFEIFKSSCSEYRITLKHCKYSFDIDSQVM